MVNNWEREREWNRAEQPGSLAEKVTFKSRPGKGGRADEGVRRAGQWQVQRPKAAGICLTWSEKPGCRSVWARARVVGGGASSEASRDD